MDAASCNFRSQLVFAVCLLFVFQNGTRIMYVEGQSASTYYLDTYGLAILISTYPQLDANVDDPCVPVPLSWIECNNDLNTRVTALNLGGRSLITELPDFSDYGVALDALQIIDLHDTSLSGPIPEFLGNFYYLRKLNLADNFFTGTIPSSLANNKNLIKDFSGNPGLYTSDTPPSPPASSSSPPPPYVTGSNPSTPTYNNRPSSSSSGKKKSNKLPIILGIVFAALLVSGVVGLIAMHKHKQRSIAAMNAAVASAQSAGISVNAPQSTGISGNDATQAA